MMILTAKVDLKKLLLMLAAVSVCVLALIVLLGHWGGAASASAQTTGDSRAEFLHSFGWQTGEQPVESTRVRIPEELDGAFGRYNVLQQSQGYDLAQYAGKRVLRYVYEITNYPGSGEPVYATVLEYRGRIIGGDITDTAAAGKIHGFRLPTQK